MAVGTAVAPEIVAVVEVAVLLPGLLAQLPPEHDRDTVCDVELKVTPAIVTEPVCVTSAVTVRPPVPPVLPSTCAVVNTLVFTVARAPTRIPVLVLNWATLTVVPGVEPIAVIVELGALTVAVCRLVENRAWVVETVVVTGMTAIAALAMPTTAMAEIIFAKLFT